MSTDTRLSPLNFHHMANDSIHRDVLISSLIAGRGAFKTIFNICSCLSNHELLGRIFTSKSRFHSRVFCAFAPRCAISKLLQAFPPVCPRSTIRARSNFPLHIFSRCSSFASSYKLTGRGDARVPGTGSGSVHDHEAAQLLSRCGNSIQ